jgi:tetratricopeptide (TPR) repeat protein
MSRLCLPHLALSALLMASSPAAAQTGSERATRAYTRALDLEAQHNYSAALPLLWEAAGLAPRDADIQNRLGEALERLGALDAALDAYRQALSARADFRKAANNLILALVKAGRGEEAVARARALVEGAPADPDRLFTLGLAQSEVNVSDAVATFRRVLDLSPTHVLARYNLALVLKRTDRLDDALRELERVLVIEKRPEALYTRAIIYWHTGDVDRAVTGLRDAARADSHYVDAFASLGSVLKAKRDWDGAAAALRRAIDLDPNRPEAHYTLGQVLRSKGDEGGARREFGEADRLRTHTRIEQEATMWTAAGTQKLDRGDASGAVDLFERAIKVNDRYAAAYYQLGRALQRLNQPAAAGRAFAAASALNPSLVAPQPPQP